MIDNEEMIRIRRMDNMTNKQAIRRLENIREYFVESYGDTAAIDKAISVLSDAPNMSWKPVKGGGFRCSYCGGEPYYSEDIQYYKFCPYCGRKNVGRADGETDWK